MANIPSDPLFSEQWHLQNNTPGLLDLNVIDVWEDYTGAGVEVAVIDDGVQRDHPDLNNNYSIYKDWDFEDDDTNASGFDSDNHGTAVAGIIAAEQGNDSGGVGVAYNSTIFGFRGLSLQNVTDAINNASGQLETNGINREADVVNMSFGPRDFFDQGTQRLSANEALTSAAINGRDGLGTILVKSAGNARARNQDTNSRLSNTNRHTVTAAAIDQDGFVSFYSNHGASVLVSAFGTHGEVVTTSREGSEGYGSDDYTTTFNGTSAAAPMVSGVVALMLEANPNLGWRDVQEILAYSARHVGTEVGQGTNRDEEYAWTFNGANNWNGGGLHFSNDYGFGLVDAKAAVRLAETWGSTPQTSANDIVISRDFLDISTTVSGFGGNEFGRFVSGNLEIEHVTVDVSFEQWYDLGDLELRLISPDGTTSILIDNSGEDSGNSLGGFGSGRWEFTSNAFRGEDVSGNWRVQLFDIDSAIVSPITVNDIDITFHGRAATNNDRFIFTEEYSDYAGQFGHRRSFNGGLGIDTINAAAVDSSTTVNLNTGTGIVDGVSISISSIENVISGDGNDTLVGSLYSNELTGMRGNDRLYGFDGNDTLNGGLGNDLMFGGTGSDTYFVDSTGDRVIEFANQGTDLVYASINYTLGGNIENLTLQDGAHLGVGNTLNNVIQGSNLNNTLYGASGHDTLHGNGGADFLSGGWGDDYLDSGTDNNHLMGDFGNDTLIGGAGHDVLNGTNYSAQGTNERDLLISGSLSDRDLFVLGERHDGLGRAFYNDLGNADYALIRDFDLYNYQGDVADRVQLVGNASSYSVSNISINGVVGAGISFFNDLIGVFQGINPFQLNLSDSNQFTYV